MISYYKVDVQTAQDYYPFGMLMPGRSGYQTRGGWAQGNQTVNGTSLPELLTLESRENDMPPEYKATREVVFTGEYVTGTGDEFLAYIADATNTGAGSGEGNGQGVVNGYRYGFNGKENDNDVKGEGNQVAFEARIYDPRIGKFLSPDPKESQYPWQSTYVFASNNPIKLIDVNGEGTGEPGPYTYESLKVLLKDMPSSHRTVSGSLISTATRKNGIRDNSAWYWDQVRKDASISWSKSNTYAMDHGFSPKADQVFIDQFPAFKEFKGQVLEMHHMNGKNGVGMALPSELHRGSGFTKLWHSSNKALAFLGAVLTLYQQSYGQDPLLVNDFTKPAYMEGEDDMAKFGTTQNDYAKVSQFASANNSRTGQMKPGMVGIYYASEQEVANFQFFDLSKAAPGTFVVGGWGAYYQNGNVASQALHKKVTYAIIFYQQNGSKSFLPVNAIQLTKPAMKSGSTLLNSKND